MAGMRRDPRSKNGNYQVYFSWKGKKIFRSCETANAKDEERRVPEIGSGR